MQQGPLREGHMGILSSIYYSNITEKKIKEEKITHNSTHNVSLCSHPQQPDIKDGELLQPFLH